jgi:CspA family cold shock protein
MISPCVRQKRTPQLSCLAPEANSAYCSASIWPDNVAATLRHCRAHDQSLSNIEYWASRPRSSGVDICRHPTQGRFMEKGTVKFYNDQKGFGFITPESGGKDVFVHATALERAGMRNLVEGQKVSFDTQEDRRSGKIAVGNIESA